MKKLPLVVLLSTLVMVSSAFGIGVEDSTPTKAAEDINNMIIDPSNFVETIDNPYFSLNPGTKFTYETDGQDGADDLNETEDQDEVDDEDETEDQDEANDEDELIETVYVTSGTKEILGVTCVVVTSTEIVDGELLEIASELYAQDKEGNVWLLGEDWTNYENGVADRTGSWKAGIDGATPFIAMKAAPQVGDSYKGEGADMVEVISLTESVSVPYGSFDNCLKVKEGSELDETGSFEYRYYVQEIGLILEIDGFERKELENVETF